MPSRRRTPRRSRPRPNAVHSCATTPPRTSCRPRCARSSAPHVKQAGSVVEPPRLRFDFTHYAGLDAAEIAEIERLVNQQILRNTQVTTDVMPIDQAISTGAMALFGEKYGERSARRLHPGFQQGALRRHARHTHRRHRRLQDRLREQHLGGRAPHRSHHRRGRRLAVSGIHRQAASHCRHAPCRGAGTGRTRGEPPRRQAKPGTSDRSAQESPGAIRRRRSRIPR